MASCRSCRSDSLKVFLSLGALPLADGLLRPDQLSQPEGRYPLDVALCESCALVQILETVPPEVLFGADYPYYSSFADALLRHSQANVEALIERRQLGSGSLVIELASNDGYLLQYYVKRGVPVLAEGPAKAAQAKGIPTRQAFFGKEFAEKLAAEGHRADVVHGNNVLAHVADLNGFVQGIATILKPTGVAVLEVPYVRDLIDHGEFDTIYHEHLCYFSVTALRTLFERHGLHLNAVEHHPIHGGSLRLFVESVDAPQGSVLEYLSEEKRAGLAGLGYYAGFAARVEAIRRELGGLLRELKARGHHLAAYGAAAKGATLLNYAGIGADLLDFVVDRNVHKQGKYMPGVHIPIVAPSELMTRRPDYVLMLPWNFRDEILAQQTDFRRQGGKFIVPIPTVEIV
jgi:SAM-dependent methyltransferase